MALPTQGPILDGLDLQDIASIRRFIYSLQMSLGVVPTIGNRERNDKYPTQVERHEVGRCHDLMESSPLLADIVYRFLENSQQDDACVLASADWLKRTATKDTFIMNSKAYENACRAWVEAIEHGDAWTYHLPEMKLSGSELDDSADKETGEAVGVEKEPEMQSSGLPLVEGTGVKDVAKDSSAVKKRKFRKSLDTDQQIPDIGEGIRDLEARLENSRPGPDFYSKLRDLVQVFNASEKGTNNTPKPHQRAAGVTKAGNPRPTPAAAKKSADHKKTTPKAALREDAGGNRKKGQQADGGDDEDDDGDKNVGEPPVREETPEYAKGPQLEQILAKGWHVPANSLRRVPEWCYYVKWKNSMATEWESVANIRGQFGFEVNLFEATMQVLNLNGPPSW